MALEVSLGTSSRLVALAILVGACPLFAANWYIRVGATGSNNGSSWANAFTAIPGTLIRGDTYYLAGGTYTGNVIIGSTVSGSTVTTLKKANAADNSGDAGWDAAFASTQAVIQGSFRILDSYMIVDGVTGEGEFGHGIKIIQTTVASGNAVVNQDSGTSFVHLLHVEIEGPGMGYATGSSGFKNNNLSVTVKGNRYAYMYVHDMSQMGFTSVNAAGTSYPDYGALFEYNVIKNTGYNLAGQHGQAIQCGSGSGASTQSYWIIRNSVFHNTGGVATAMIACLGYSTNQNFQIRNNIFRNDNLSFDTDWIPFDNSKPAVSPGVIYFSSTSSTAENILVANNTFYQLSRATVYFAGTNTNNTVINNLWMSSNFNIVTQGATGSYNDYYACFNIISSGIYGVPYGETGQQGESSSPVVDAAAADFRLIAGANAIGNGLNLSSVFTDDIVGTTRPSSGAWDIGAYQSTAGRVSAGPITRSGPISIQ